MLATHLRFLPISIKELSLRLTLSPSQSFRWTSFKSVRVTQSDEYESTRPVDGDEDIEWACGFKDRTVVLRQTRSGIYYRSLYNYSLTPTSFIADLKHDTTLSFLKSYFQLDVSLKPLYGSWSTDRVFAMKLKEAGGRLDGMRVLKQDPFETLISFICSANNNISRITQMVHSVSTRLGSPLPHPLAFSPSDPLHTLASLSIPSPPRRNSKKQAEELSFYAFPRPEDLTSEATDMLLRSLGFGYRAPYIRDSCQLLMSKSESCDEYLTSLSDLGADEARIKLMEFKGVGPKVASCVALFGLGLPGVVPVDTHVYQIAVRDYKFVSTSTSKLNAKPSITPIIHKKIQDKFEDIFGEFAGWAQQILFFADLKTTIKSEREIGQPTVPKVEKGKGKVEAKGKFEVELEEIIKSPTKKRGRKPAVVKAEDMGDAELKVEEEEHDSTSMVERIQQKIKKSVKMEIEIEAVSCLKSKRQRVL